MPLYDYRCQACGTVFEVRQKFSDELLTQHEGCGGAVERLVSAPALQFKGSGWYINDYAKSGSSGKKDDKAGGGTESKDSGGDSKGNGSESTGGSKSDAPAKPASGTDAPASKPATTTESAKSSSAKP